jgi:hypothetical protein
LEADGNCSVRWRHLPGDVHLARVLPYDVIVRKTFTYQRQAVFPAVTFCNMNPVKRSAVDENPHLSAVTSQTNKKKRRKKRDVSLASDTWSTVDTLTTQQLVDETYSTASFYSEISSKYTATEAHTSSSGLTDSSSSDLQTTDNDQITMTSARTVTNVDLITPYNGQSETVQLLSTQPLVNDDQTVTSITTTDVSATADGQITTLATQTEDDSSSTTRDSLVTTELSVDVFTEAVDQNLTAAATFYGDASSLSAESATLAESEDTSTSLFSPLDYAEDSTGVGNSSTIELLTTPDLTNTSLIEVTEQLELTTTDESLAVASNVSASTSNSSTQQDVTLSSATTRPTTNSKTTAKISTAYPKTTTPSFILPYNITGSLH